MSEIKGYLLTKEEEKACVALIKKMRERETQKFYVDFWGYCEIEAENPHDAQNKFWELINNNKPLPENVYDIWCIEQKTEDNER